MDEGARRVSICASWTVGDRKHTPQLLRAGASLLAHSCLDSTQFTSVRRSRFSQDRLPGGCVCMYRQMREKKKQLSTVVVAG